MKFKNRAERVSTNIPCTLSSIGSVFKFRFTITNVSMTGFCVECQEQKHAFTAQSLIEVTLGDIKVLCRPVRFFNNNIGLKIVQSSYKVDDLLQKTINKYR
jgi:hypothetical protein